MKSNQRVYQFIILFLLIALVSLIYFIFDKLQTNYDSVENDTKSFETIESKIKIGFSLGTLKEERWIKDRDILMAKVKELDADIIVQNANNDDQDQLKQVKYLLEQNIDVLIIVPNDFEKASVAVELAKKQGVKVISYDRLVLKSNVDAYISFDNEKVGELMAQYIVDNLPNGNILIINGATNDNNTKTIKIGYDKVIKAAGGQNKFKVVAEEWAQNWMKEYAFRVTDNLLQKGYGINGVIAGDDELAGGAIEALSEHRLAGKTLVVGQDADLAACQRIVEGTQFMSVYKPIEKLSDITAKTAIALAKGEELEIERTIYDGKYNVPYIVLEPIPVDKYNIDETIIKDGFHTREDVYRNSPK